MNVVAQRRLTPPLAIAALVLGLTLLALFAGVGRGVRWDPPRAAEAIPDHPAAKLPPPLPLEQFAVVWTKPLFSPDRKPMAQVAGDGGGNLGDMQLTGIILTPEARIALLHDKAGNEIRVREGAALPDGSWTLAELQPRSAFFASASGRTELKLPNGAPIDAPAQSGSNANVQAGGEGATKSGDENGNAVQVSSPTGTRPPPSARMMSGGQGRPGESAPGDMQQQRIQRLKDIIRRRRAEQQGQRPAEGER